MNVRASKDNQSEYWQLNVHLDSLQSTLENVMGHWITSQIEDVLPGQNYKAESVKVKYRPNPASFCLFSYFSQHNDKYSTEFDN